MAREAGVQALGVGGNLGTPALDLLDDANQLYVLELSSFQLETTETLKLVAATVLNISPDHLDRHGSLERYTAAKARIYAHAQTAVVNRDDRSTHTGAHTARRVVSFGPDAPAKGHYGLIEHDGETWAARGETPLFPISSLKIEGLHNAANALAAFALAEAAGPERGRDVQGALFRFPGLAHRCEWVADHRRRVVDQRFQGHQCRRHTRCACRACRDRWSGSRGGQGKGQDFTALRAPLKDKARVAILFGQDAAAIARDLAGQVAVTARRGSGGGGAWRRSRPLHGTATACCCRRPARVSTSSGTTRNAARSVPRPRAGAEALSAQASLPFGLSPARYGLDTGFCLAVAILIAWGLVMVASASVAVSERMAGASTLYYFNRQLMFMADGPRLSRPMAVRGADEVLGKHRSAAADAGPAAAGAGAGARHRGRCATARGAGFRSDRSCCRCPNRRGWR